VAVIKALIHTQRKNIYSSPNNILVNYLKYVI